VRARDAGVRARRATTRAGITLAASFALFAVAGFPDAQGASKPARADLVVSRGSVALSKGRLTGSFLVKNTGSATAPSAAATLATVVNGRVVYLTTASVRALDQKESARVRVKVAVPSAIGTGRHELSACADRRGAVKERSESNNCLDLGTFDGSTVDAPKHPTSSGRPVDVPETSSTAPATGAPAPTNASTPPPASGPQAPSNDPPPSTTPATTPPTPASTVPTAPIAHPTNTVFKIGSYWAYVPSTYDATNVTPFSLLVWMHGCGGESEGTLWNASLGDTQPYIGLAPGGADGACWNVNTSPASVLAAIADIGTHFNIDRRRIVLGGYSSGGDMAYRMGLNHPSMFAGLLVENTSPFRDSGVTAAQAQAATTKFHVVHVAHIQDATYPLAGVRTETNAMIAAGFPLTRVELDGTHYDDAGDTVNGHSVPGTDADLRTRLLPHMADGWLAPAP
jgi:pimeloyl-ACP methyl ester carboxylesterase